MIVTTNSVLRQQVFDNIRATVTKKREEIHLSDLIYCTRKAYWRFKGMAPTPSDELCLLWLTGYAFQAFMFPLDQEVTFTVDGIDCTPDIPTGIEVKSTRQSMARFDFDSMIHWQRQILGYCKALHKLEYDLAVMYVCGDYKPPFPNLECYHIQTTPEEVEDNWREILGKRCKLSKAITEDVPPEVDCADWEWKYCEYVDLCQDTTCWRKRQIGGKNG